MLGPTVHLLHRGLGGLGHSARDTSELGRCQPPIKSRRPVRGVRRAANPLQATTLEAGQDLSEPTLRTVAPMLTLKVLSRAWWWLTIAFGYREQLMADGITESADCRQQ